MSEIKKQLIEAFRADHAMLCNGFHVLAGFLRDDDFAGARNAAAKINHEAGPHIAFEEEDFYPAISKTLASGDIEKLVAEHEKGRQLLEKILVLDDLTIPERSDTLSFLKDAEKFEKHIVDCVELLGALDSLSDDDIQMLFERMKFKSLNAPNWLDQV